MISSGQNVTDGWVAATCNHCGAYTSHTDAWWDFELVDPIGGWECPTCGVENELRRRTE